MHDLVIERVREKGMRRGRQADGTLLMDSLLTGRFLV